MGGGKFIGDRIACFIVSPLPAEHVTLSISAYPHWRVQEEQCISAHSLKVLANSGGGGGAHTG